MQFYMRTACRMQRRVTAKLSANEGGIHVKPFVPFKHNLA